MHIVHMHNALSTVKCPNSLNIIEITVEKSFTCPCAQDISNWGLNSINHLKNFYAGAFL